MEDQKALTSKKAKRLLQGNGGKVAGTGQNQVEFKTLTQHIRGRKSVEMGLEDEESQEEEPRNPYNKRKNSKAAGNSLVEIEINQGKERQRSSELGISNKYHRRLQTSMLGKSGGNAQTTEVFSDPENQN